MDGLADSGVLFTRAFANFPWCAPSRNSFLTGRRPDVTRAWNFVDHFREPNSGLHWTSLPQHFKQNGYYTTSIGKIYHPNLPPREDYPLSWSDVPVDHGKLSCPSRGPWCLYDSDNTTDPTFADVKIVDDAIARLQQRPAGQPFFLAVGFRNPHLPWRYPQATAKLYPPQAQIPVATNRATPGAPHLAWQWPLYFGAYTGMHNISEQVVVSDDELHNGTHAYWATISFTDIQIGRMLAALEAEGVANDTLVLLWGDHGQNLGEHNTWCKMTDWEHSLRVPMMGRAPWTGVSRRIYDGPVELVDMYRTISELAGIPDVESGVQGTSMARAFQDPGQPVPQISEAAFSQTTRCLLRSCIEAGAPGQFVPSYALDKFYAPCASVNRTQFGYMGYSIRTAEWRFTQFFPWRANMTADLSADCQGDTFCQLYSHVNDTAPFVLGFESINYAGNPLYASVLASLSAKLKASIAAWQP